MAIKIIGTESRMVVAGGWGEGDGVSVLQDEKTMVA